jgi:hypothetical protein
MDAATWDERYASTELVWSTAPNAFVVEEVADLRRDARSTSPVERVATRSGWPSRAGTWSSSSSPLSRSRRRSHRPRAWCHAAHDAGRRDGGTWPRAGRPRARLLPAAESGPLAGALRHADARRTRRDAARDRARARQPRARVRRTAPDPTYLPTVDDVLRALRGHGLEVVKAGQVRRTVDTEDGPREAIDLLVRAKRPRG